MMKIEKILLIMVLLGFGVAAYPQKGDQYLSKQYTGLTPKDGEAYLNIMQIDEKSQIMYLLRNDEKNLYVDLLLSDRAVIQKTMMFGLTTWIDPTGKKKKTLGIEFPMAGGPGGEQGMGHNNNSGKDRQAMMALAMQEKNSKMLLKGFSGKGSEKEINPMTGNGVRGKFENLEAGKVRMTLIIPLDMVDRQDKEAMGQPLSIGFETGYMDLNRSGMAASSGPRDEGGHYHGDGPPGGGMEGQGNGQRQANINQLASPSKMWLKQVKLAVEP